MDSFHSLKQIISIPYYSNLQCSTLGLDSIDHCFNKSHYKSFGDIDYVFNELGYRAEYQYHQNHQNAILAVGDSFTLGLGVNVDDTWPVQLSKILNYPVLNFSLNGASNDWIARRTSELLQFFNPKAVIIHYTFSHRRENPNTDWYDNERTECDPMYTEIENYKNWEERFFQIVNLGVPVIHSFIPNWHTSVVDYSAMGTNVIAPELKLDIARDGFHYGSKTHQSLAEKMYKLLATQGIM